MRERKFCVWLKEVLHSDDRKCFFFGLILIGVRLPQIKLRSPLYRGFLDVLNVYLIVVFLRR